LERASKPPSAMRGDTKKKAMLTIEHSNRFGRQF